MKRPVLHQIVSYCIAASVFFSAAAPIYANTFTLPNQLSYPGLTFTTPLTYTNPLPVHQPTSVISFKINNKLVISKNNKKKSTEEITITPTLGVLAPTYLSVLQPTPTVYVPSVVTPTVTETPTAAPTTEPTAQPTVSPASTNTPAPQSNPGGLNAADIFGMVNAYRAQQGLPAFQQDPRSCTLAAVRAPEVAGEVASGNLHAGLIAMNLPYWNTENIIDMNSDQAAFNWWINDPIHHEAIVGNFTYSCMACSGNSCAEEFTNFQPK
jgi:uncharacterized protein YkwD